LGVDLHRSTAALIADHIIRALEALPGTETGDPAVLVVNARKICFAIVTLAFGMNFGSRPDGAVASSSMWFGESGRKADDGQKARGSTQVLVRLSRRSMVNPTWGDQRYHNASTGNDARGRRAAAR